MRRKLFLDSSISAVAGRKRIVCAAAERGRDTTGGLCMIWYCRVISLGHLSSPSPLSLPRGEHHTGNSPAAGDLLVKTKLSPLTPATAVLLPRSLDLATVVRLDLDVSCHAFSGNATSRPSGRVLPSRVSPEAEGDEVMEATHTYQYHHALGPLLFVTEVKETRTIRGGKIVETEWMGHFDKQRSSIPRFIPSLTDTTPPFDPCSPVRYFNSC